MNPALRSVPANGLDLAVWDWPGDGPALVFAHATGFHGRCWDRIVRMFPGRRSVAFDFRGHGRSAKPDAPYQWPDFGRDLTAVVEQLGLSGAIGIGHSMGGHAAIAAAPHFAALLLIDPTIFSPEYYGRPRHDASFIRRRRNTWRSPEEMFERFRSRPPFALWEPEILRDYCQFGLLPQGGEFVLACPPPVEASIYEQSNAPEANPYTAIPAIRQPVVVMRSDVPWDPGAFNLGASPTAPDLASKFPQGRDLLLKGRGHYIPMECPEAVGAEISSLISSQTAWSA